MFFKIFSSWRVSAVFLYTLLEIQIIQIIQSPRWERYQSCKVGLDDSHNCGLRPQPKDNAWQTGQFHLVDFLSREQKQIGRLVDFALSLASSSSLSPFQLLSTGFFWKSNNFVESAISTQNDPKEGWRWYDFQKICFSFAMYYKNRLWRTEVRIDWKIIIRTGCCSRWHTRKGRGRGSRPPSWKRCRSSFWSRWQRSRSRCFILFLFQGNGGTRLQYNRQGFAERRKRGKLVRERSSWMAGIGTW